MYRSPVARLLWCALGAVVGIALSLFLAALSASLFFFISNFLGKQSLPTASVCIAARYENSLADSLLVFGTQ